MDIKGGETEFEALTYQRRLEMLRARKLEHAKKKVELTGPLA